ncbi:protein THEMIS2-like [Carassius gibelio]|uniref:protein THEMIS2-like n=1 Tax=Carassius gibelio TaxID=101364 RepID=UPI00227910E4|nr:protein THEMIS2-like [Carassius gibelio]
MGDLQSLRVFINCLDQQSLPRVLQICSGVYFQGSIYELSGSEVCLSTGDLVKVIGLQLLSVSCEEIDTGASFELPAGYPGHFRLVSEDLPYNSLEEIVSLCPVGADSCGSFTFISQNELTLDNFTLPAGKQLALLSVEVAKNGERLARCQVVEQNMASAEILLPLSLRGEFYERQGDRGFSLQEIMSSSRLSCRRFRNTDENSGSLLVFSPVYEISAIMQMRKNIVKFPSSLEVDVQDVTEQFQDFVFITPLSMTEVAIKPAESFPTMAEIIDGPEANQFFNCNWFQGMQRSRHLVLHSCRTTTMMLASTPKGRKGKQYFIISENYGGRMRRRAREFESVYEIYLASTQTPGLKVSVTRHCEAVEEEGMPALSVGEQLEVLGKALMDGLKDSSGAAQKIESLLCKKTVEVDDEDEEDEEDSKEISLPLFMAGHFVEKLSDNKKYKLADLVSSSLPVDVKVVTRDKELEKDPLMGLPALQLEETFTETTVLSSLPNKPHWCFELPVHWLQMSLCFTSDPLPWSSNETPELHIETVTEVTEKFYYEYHKLTSKIEEPPPRPPKRKPSSSEVPKKPPKSESKSPNLRSAVTKQLDNLSLGHIKGRRAPAPPPHEETSNHPSPQLPKKGSSIAESATPHNMYVRSPKAAHTSAQKLSDSDHDYESIQESFENFIS